MAEEPSLIEWYLARDGHQHGPLSESEMRVLVELGHLRSSDLVWRNGFPEWRAADAVFAIHNQVMPPAEPAAPVVVQYAPNAPVSVQPVEPVYRAPQPEPMQRQAVAPAAEAIAPAQPQLTSPEQLRAALARQIGNAPPGGIAPAAAISQTASAAPYQQGPMMASPLQQSAPAPHGQTPQAQQASKPAAAVPYHASAGQPFATAPQSVAAPVRRRAVVERPDTADEDAPPAGRSWRRLIAAGIAGLLIVAAGTTAYFKGNQIAALLPGLNFLSDSGANKAPGNFRDAPFATAGGDFATIDRDFQRITMWQHIKREYPDWYAERVQETAKFSAEKRTDGQIAKHLAEAVVALRRRHATQALTASPDRLKFVASAFLQNLQALSKRNTDTCYGFISQGETYPAVLDLLQEKDVSEPLQRQVMAVFEAIADGRKEPQIHLPPRKADYDLLSAELTARGWSQADLQTFSDPRALGRAAPSQVCKMVQDWFAAQIAIKDPASQLRLLVESLRPVVAG